MGYFNYFIKCIIRNIAYKLCKPKVFLTVLLSIIILFVLHSYGYCSWTDGDIQAVHDGLATITSNQGVMISQLSSLGVDVSELQTTLNNINARVLDISADAHAINLNTQQIINDISTLNTNIMAIYNSLEDNHAETISVMNSNNQAILDELETIKDILTGSESQSTSHTVLGTNLSINVNGTIVSPVTVIEIPFEKGFTYTVDLRFLSTSNTYAYYMFDNVLATNTNTVLGTSFIPLGNLSANVSSSFQVSTREYKYLYLVPSSAISSVSVSYSNEGLIDVIDRTNQQLNNNIQQGNQLQQEQNQLQQEQNNFIKQEQSDSDVSVDGFNSVDANDITSAGLTGVFTNIYNSITSWSSKDIKLPIPYTNKNITIPANYTQNMLSSFGGSWIITFISSIYYFIVARFIIYSITGIVNSIKSGSILETDSKNNITTDML